MNSETKKLCGEILQKLLKKYDKRSAKQVETNRRITLSPSEIYKAYHANDADMRRKEAINEAIHILESESFVAVKRLKYSDEIEKIYMPADSASSVRDFLQNQCGITPRNRIKEEVFQLFAAYKHGGALVQAYCESLRQHLNETAEEIEFARIDANLKMIDFLEKNSKSLYVREVSVLVYGDSKWFQENNYEEICSLLRALLDVPQSDYEPADAILERFHVITSEQEILLKGRWKLHWKNFSMDSSQLRGGIAISSADIPFIACIEIGTDKVMTVENKTAFQRMDEANFSYLYLGGYANRHQLAFLKKVIEDNPELKYVHFGDIDAGGFLIHQNLCQATGKQFELHCMGISELENEKFAIARKPLTSNDVRRLHTLLEKEEYRHTIEYMLANNCKMEQEIVSLFFAGGINMYQLFDFEKRDCIVQGYHFPCENPNHVVCLIHGIGEHAGRFSRVAEHFNEAGIAVVSMDLRGHGRSQGVRGACAPRKEVLKDIDALIEYAQEFYPGVPIVMYGHSMGGNITLDYRARGGHNDVPAGYIISAPWIRLVRPVSGGLLKAVKLLTKIAPNFKIKSEFPEEKLGNVEYVRPYKKDPMVHPYATALCAYEGFTIGTALENGTNEDNGRAKHTPCLLMHGTKDLICDIQGSCEFAKLQNPQNFTMVEWPGYYHEIHNGGPDGESGEAVIQRAIAFIESL